AASINPFLSVSDLEWRKSTTYPLPTLFLCNTLTASRPFYKSCHRFIPIPRFTAGIFLLVQSIAYPLHSGVARFQGVNGSLRRTKMTVIEGCKLIHGSPVRRHLRPMGRNSFIQRDGH